LIYVESGFVPRRRHKSFILIIIIKRTLIAPVPQTIFRHRVISTVIIPIIPEAATLMEISLFEISDLKCADYTVHRNMRASKQMIVKNMFLG
jgi:hypothetical protein